MPVRSATGSFSPSDQSGGRLMAGKDKGGSKSSKKNAALTLKEKREAKKIKRDKRAER